MMPQQTLSVHLHTNAPCEHSGRLEDERAPLILEKGDYLQAQWHTCGIHGVFRINTNALCQLPAYI